MRDRLSPFAIALAVFLLDRVTKLWIASHVSAWDTVVVVPKFFNIVHAENPGAAFSLFAGSGGAVRTFFLVGLSLAVLVFISVILWQPSRGGFLENPALRTGLALVLGGALGNVYDRIAQGTVTDFLQFYVNDHYWPSFNVADSAISIGAGLLLLDMWRSRRQPEGSSVL